MKTDGTIAKVLLSGALTVGLGFVGAGCNSGSDGKGTLLAAGTASVGTQLGAFAPGAIPGIPGDPAALEGPQVEIVSPARASHTTSRKITVEGVVTDLGAGISDVRVQGRAVTLAAGGAFREEVDLEAGMNTVVVEAWDNANHKRERFVSVVAGDLAPEGDALADVASIRVTDAAMDLIEPKIVQGIEAQRPQITQQVLATKVDGDTKIKSFTFGAVNAGVDLIAGGVRFTATMDTLAMDIEHKAKFLLVFSTTKKGTVRAQQMRIEGVAQVSVQNGQVTTNVVQVTATAAGFSVPDWAEKEQANIRRGFENGFAAAAAKGIADGLNAAFKTTSGTVAQGAGGQATDLAWNLTTLTCDDAGATALFAANVTPKAGATVGAEQRSVVVRGGLANLAGGGGAGPNVALAVHQDLINRSLHAAWRGGALKVVIDQAAIAATAPTSPVVLDTNALIALAPELAAVLQPGIPIELVIEGELPAVMTLRAGPMPHLLDIGALKVTTVVLDPVKGRTPLGEASYALRGEVLLVDGPGGLRLQSAGKVEVHVDSLGTAQPGAELVLEKMAVVLGPQLLQMALATQAPMALPTTQGFTVGSLQVQQPLDSNLVVLGTAKAAP
jgi:hypothetical protein